MKRNINPVFKNNYKAYDKEEFLVDANMEFFKIKKLLEKNPKTLKDDPLLAVDYLKIIDLIKRRRLYEDANDQFHPHEQFESTYMDPEVKDNKKQIDELRKA